jgi:UrcA family protein
MNANRNTTRMLASFLALVATAGIATTAQADDFPRYDDVVVSYADLNLDSAAGNQKLHARLANAAARACGSEPAIRDIERRAQYRACVEETLNRAVDEVSSSDQRALRLAAGKHNVS